MKIKISFKEHPFRFILFLIFIVSFGLRIAISLELLKNDIQVANPSGATDMATYMELSQKIADGTYSESFYYQPFYYVVFLPSLIFIFGKNVLFILIVQSFISALTIIFASLSAAMLRGKKAGIYTALFLAFSSCLTLYVPYHLIETLQAFWLSLISYSAIIALKRKKIIIWIILGLLTSFAILTRGNIWFFVPGIILAAFISGKRKSLKHSIIFPVLFFIAVILPQIPFSLWNYSKTKHFSGPSTAAGAVLGLGNTPEAPPGGRNPGTGPGPMEYPETYMEWSAGQEKIPIIERIFDWAAAEPLAFLELQFRKILLFWDHREIPNNIAFEYNGKKSHIWRIFAFIPTSFLIVTFLSCFFFNLFLLLKTKKFPSSQFSIAKPIILNAYFVFAYCLATAAFYILARFRAPSLPLFAIFAGIFIRDLSNIFRKKSVEKLKIAFFAIFISIFIVFFSYDCYRYYEPIIMKVVRPHGTQVKFDDKRLLVLDNGPLTFGGWEPLEIREKMEIIKKFTIPNFRENYSAKFAFEIFMLTPGEIALKINGLDKKIISDHEGKMEKIFQLENLKSPQIEIEFIKVDAKAFIIVDKQRQYSRTLINNNINNGELVARLYITPPE